MESEMLKEHASLERAIDIAIWMNFKYRKQQRSYVVVQDKKTKLYLVVPQMGRRKSLCIKQPKDYSLMSYEQIKSIRSEVQPLSHWEEIMGLFTSTHGEILRFNIRYQIP